MSMDERISRREFLEQSGTMVGAGSTVAMASFFARHRNDGEWTGLSDV
jgi:hypothetical protein